jgi:peptidoglycan/LPS O-acetylase OafA/YrhL
MNNRATQDTAFRHDINALRAASVVLVLLFHAGLKELGGGFVGVDIFFVISGYLMTSIIFARAMDGRLSLGEFYGARFRRLYPALLALCVAVLAVNFLFVDPITAATTARNAFYSLLFLSNAAYALEDSYFAPASETNWLLHTWTLSVEFQFYLLYPAALAILFKCFSTRTAIRVIYVATIALLITTLVLVAQSTVSYQRAFFLLPSRAWELLAGGCVALMPPLQWPARAKRAACALLFPVIIVAAFYIDQKTPWPSIWTVWPVAAAAAIIAIDDRHSAWAKNVVVQRLGLWSYSIYLWHWPIMVAAAYFCPAQPVLLTAATLVGSIVAGACSRSLIEIRLTRFLFDEQGSWPVRAALSSGIAITLAASFAGYWLAGFETLRTRTLPPEARQSLVDYREATADWQGKSACGDRLVSYGAGGRICRLGGGTNDVAVIGDSHVEQLLPRFQNLSNDGPGVAFFYRDGCAPIPGLDRTVSGMNCSNFVQDVLELIQKEHFKRVVIIALWTTYFQTSDGSVLTTEICERLMDSCVVRSGVEEFTNSLDTAFRDFAVKLAGLKADGMDVTLVKQNPVLYGVSAQSLYKETFLTGRAAGSPPVELRQLKQQTRYTDQFLDETAESARIRLVDPAKYLCDPDRCAVYDQGRFVYRDGNHIRSSLITSVRFSFFDTLLFDPVRLNAAPATWK